MVNVRELKPGMRIRLFDNPEDKYGITNEKKKRYLGGVYTVKNIDVSSGRWFARCEETRTGAYDFAWYENLIECIIDFGEEVTFDTVDMDAFLLGL